ncbi:MAG: hypothetical protein WBO69_04030, partial [Thermoanaerobaculia bacterium]
LDDYHRIAPSSEIHELLRLLLEHPPQPLHLVLVTRRDPPLAMASMRASRQVDEVRLQDLRFTVTETAEFLSAPPAGQRVVRIGWADHGVDRACREKRRRRERSRRDRTASAPEAVGWPSGPLEEKGPL